ncbi:hypothetical protein [Sphingobacterium sp. 1.A.5]|jgi:hypothetical protein|uniref:hypothetical protein n=1 Tax=Sphingobacterium sp. 1.A.5 TaxID=2044604 RepID=UPI001181A5CD|nr:hypothetical protein [Sphingobacterium sp. 1.A.5]
MEILKDLLEENLDVVFCGTAVGNNSACVKVPTSPLAEQKPLHRSCRVWMIKSTYYTNKSKP